MGKLEPASDPSMEDILASIRRIIADDDGPRKAPAAPPHLSVVERPAPSAPVAREPSSTVPVPPVRFEAAAPAPHEPAPVAATVAPAQARMPAETVASPVLVARTPLAASVPAAVPEQAGAHLKPVVQSVAATSLMPSSEATASPASVIQPAAPTPAQAVQPRTESPVPTHAEPVVGAARPVARAEASPAFPLRSGALSPASIELEVARLLASPRPPDKPLRPTPPPQQPASSTAPPAPQPVARPPVVEFASRPAPAPASALQHADTMVAVVPTAGSAAPAGSSVATPNGLMSANSDAAVRSAFDQLADTMFSREARSLEDVVKDMMRPMLRDWLDDNLPPLVERLVREEIQRVSRGRK